MGKPKNVNEKFIDFFVLAKLLARLDLVKSLIPEQDEWDDENRRRKIFNLVSEWENDIAKQIEKIVENEK